MKITERQLEAARALLPDADVTAQGGHFGFRVGADFYITDCHEDTAIFCDLLERAVGARRIDFTISSPTAPGDTWEVRLILSHEEDIVVERPTKLEAWLEAVAELMEETK